MLRIVPGTQYVLNGKMIKQRGNGEEFKPFISVSFLLPVLPKPATKELRTLGATYNSAFHEALTCCSYLPCFSHLVIALLLMHFFPSLSCEFPVDRNSIFFTTESQ